MILFTDLDNTLIYSYKRDIGEHKRCVEIYEGRQISFITEKTYELMKKAGSFLTMIPVTTRTAEQYDRIDFGLGKFRYALVCNGGVLLKNGEEDNNWYKESLGLVADAVPELYKAEQILKSDINVDFEVRNIRGLFIFTKSREPDKTAGLLNDALDPGLVGVYSNGAKVYVVPNSLNKGTACERLKKSFPREASLAGGDSEFDIPMLTAADAAVCPVSLENRPETAVTVSSGELLSERMLSLAVSLSQ